MALVRRDVGKPVTPDSRAGERSQRPRRSRSSGQSPDKRWSEVGPAPRKLTPPGRAHFFLATGPPLFGQKVLDRWGTACYTVLLMGRPVLLSGGDSTC